MRIWLILLVLVFFVGCVSDAPRDNPLDAKSRLTSLRLEGRVFTYYQPYQPVAGAKLYLLPLNRLTESDADGYYAFNGLQAGIYTVICQKNGFASDTAQIDLTTEQTHHFHLDRLPSFEQLTINTHHQARWFPVEDAYYLDIKATVSDGDGRADINLVDFQIPGINYRDTLQAGSEAGSYSRLFSQEELPVGSLEQLVGLEFVFRATDHPGKSVYSDKHYLTRVINPVPVVEAPVGLETVAADSLVFQWQKMSLNFEFSYKIQLYQINLGLSTLIEEIAPIAADQTSYRYPSALPGGDYLWRVLIVDRYGNTSGSKEGVFRVP